MPGSPADPGVGAVRPERAPGPGDVVVRAADYLWFADLALGEMARIVEGLGDERANLAPPLPGANSAYAILTHCLGVLEYWGGATVAGRSIERDRDAEFRARGEVAELVARTEAARRRLHEDLGSLDSLAEPSHVVRNRDDPVPYAETQGAVLLHILEELFQHLGQMEITRDTLQATAPP
jgi:uncharacterized damage-inducible protein DinB